MRLRVSAILFAALLCLAPTASWADLASYSQDFEGLAPTDGLPGEFNPSDLALIEDGWQVFGNVFTPTGGYVGGYGPFGAPNGGFGGFAFSLVGAGQGGPEQGDQQLVVFNDYNNAFEHNRGNFVEANVYQQQTIGAADVGKTWVFEFDAKRGDIQPPTTAAAFIKILNPGFIYIPLDMTNLPETWGSYSISVYIAPELVGRILQFGFLNKTTSFAPSGNVYDNVGFREEPRSMGFWKHQCRDLGFTQVSSQELDDLFADIDVASGAFSECAPIDCSVLDLAPPANDMREKAERQALALWLNVASGRLFGTSSIDLAGLTSATRVGDAIAEIETTLCDSGATHSDLETAKDIAEALNVSGEDMELAGPTSSLAVKAGQTVTITLGLVNMSPDAENYSLTTSGGWPVSLSEQLIPGLGSGQIAVLTAEVRVPSIALKGQTALVEVTAQDLFSEVGLQRQAVIEFEVRGNLGGGRKGNGSNRPVDHQLLPDED